ncbi:MAG TPA: aminotransferase class V-fold PLP-dependent enzyme [Chloroflexota bacterium]|nr:aminotransferase class V-fold PLP-dependent enzyme [Chloroflexota bacterium]
MNVEALRDQIPALRNAVYLNAGGIGPSPKAVTDTLIRLALEVSENGPDGMAFSREEFTHARATREKIARFLGAAAEEITLVRSTAEGFDMVGHGLRWRAGDEVIFGGGDHPAARAIWAILARRHGIRPVRLELPDDSPESILEDVHGLITPRTRLISISHVTSENGLRVPARELAELAHQHGAKLILDGCQAVGQFPIDVREIGCDFYAAGAYKWLLGPFGTGFLWVRRDLLPEIEPSWVGAGGAVRFDPETAAWESLPSGEKFEFGARYWPTIPAMAAAIDFVTAVGLDAIAVRSHELVTRMCERLEGRAGVVEFAPRCEALRTGMVGAAVRGMDGKELAERLRARGIHLRANHGPDGITGVRLCLAFFVTEDEVDRTAEAIAEIAAGR